jgi:(2R)-sulfolactate sulfo-lyase subunit alpha
MEYGILVHEKQDDVGVAVLDIGAGTEIGAATLEGESVGLVKVIQDIPLGHKVALHDLSPDQNVIEYGHPIGHATQKISLGEHVHVHNLRTNRWRK